MLNDLGYLFCHSKLGSLDALLVCKELHPDYIHCFWLSNFYFLTNILKLSVMACIYIYAMLVLGRLRQEASEFEANLAT